MSRRLKKSAEPSRPSWTFWWTFSSSKKAQEWTETLAAMMPTCKMENWLTPGWRIRWTASRLAEEVCLSLWEEPYSDECPQNPQGRD